MCEKNPFQTVHVGTAPNGNRNPKGRPPKHQSTTFGTRPDSIVSQLIQKMLSQNNVKLPIERDPEVNTPNNYSTLIEEFHQTPYHLSPKPKKKKPKIYSCEFSNCNYITKVSSNLHKHRRRHTGEKPYLCDRCSFRTNFSNSLNVHKRLHTTERPYECDSCDYKCNSISNLKKHSRTRHNDKDLDVMKTAPNII